MGESCHGGDGQRKSPPVHQTQIPILGEPRTPELAPADVVVRCENLLDAVRLAVHLSNYSHEHICDCLGIDKGHWSRMMQGRAHFPPNKLVPLMELAGNLAPLQYLSAQCGYRLPAPRVGLKTMEAA